MVIESDTPNPDFHNQLEIKDDLLNDGKILEITLKVLKVVKTILIFFFQF